MIIEVIQICVLIHVNPATSASGERSFSTARRIKSWFRAKMSQNTHKTRTDDLRLVDVANEFKATNEKRKRNFGTFTVQWVGFYRLVLISSLLVTVVVLNLLTCSCSAVYSVQYVAQYRDGTSIRTLKAKTQFLRRPFQLSVNKVFRMKAEHFGFKMKVLASWNLAKQSQKTPFCSRE